MIADHTALQTLTTIAVPTNATAPATSQVPTVIPRLTSALRFVGAAVVRWTKTPALPYAALWEASVVAGAGTDDKLYEPDPFAAEHPFTRLQWPRC